MTIREMRGDLLASAMQTLVCPVNTVGVMGAGLAKSFRLRWPAIETDYRHACAAGMLQPGQIVQLPPQGGVPGIIFFPTKRHWREPSRYADIRVALMGLELACDNPEWGIASLAVPALGCGLGGLDWAAVRPLIEMYLGDLDIPIELYPPQ